MALGVGTFEVRTTGDDNNAGYFNPRGSSPGTDYSQQDAAQVIVDGASVSCTVHTTTTQLNIVGASVALWNRNALRILSGSMTPGLYEITAIDTGNNRVTVDRAAGTAGQTGLGRLGGCFATPGNLGQFMTVALQRAYIKSGTYDCSSTPNVSGGRLSFGNIRIHIEGYGVTRGDLGTKPTLRATSGSMTIVAVTSDNRNTFLNLKYDANGQSTVVGGSGGSGLNSFHWLCEAVGCSTGFSAVRAMYCRARNGSGDGFNNCVPFGCLSHHNVTGFSAINNAVDCFAYLNSGSGFSHISQGDGAHYLTCLAYGNGADGWRHNTAAAINCVNCVSTGNGGYGWNYAGGTLAGDLQSRLFNCADFGNTLGRIPALGITLDYNPITLTADPFVDAPNGDFRPNQVAGGGLLLLNSGLILPGQSLANNVGPMQAAAAGNVLIFKRGVI